MKKYFVAIMALLLGVMPESLWAMSVFYWSADGKTKIGEYSVPWTHDDTIELFKQRIGSKFNMEPNRFKLFASYFLPNGYYKRGYALLETTGDLQTYLVQPGAHVDIYPSTAKNPLKCRS